MEKFETFKWGPDGVATLEDGERCATDQESEAMDNSVDGLTDEYNKVVSALIFHADGVEEVEMPLAKLLKLVDSGRHVEFDESMVA